jgi:hypothetical protein
VTSFSVHGLHLHFLSYDSFCGSWIMQFQITRYINVNSRQERFARPTHFTISGSPCVISTVSMLGLKPGSEASVSLLVYFSSFRLFTFAHDSSGRVAMLIRWNHITSGPVRRITRVSIENCRQTAPFCCTALRSPHAGTTPSFGCHGCGCIQAHAKWSPKLQLALPVSY